MSEEKCHHFIEGELRGLYGRELKVVAKSV